MKLDELQITKDVEYWENEPKYLLKKYGWKVLGSGLDGAVAENPNKSYVLKLFVNSSRYVHFVEFVREHHGNPHLPKFSRFTRKVPGMKTEEHFGLSYVRMEKLKKINSRILLDRFMPEVWAMRLAGFNYRITPSKSLDTMLFPKLEDLGFKTDLFNPTVTEQIWEKLGRKPDQSWIDVCKDLFANAQSLGYTELDLHGGNLMLRGKTLVITDPY